MGCRATSLVRMAVMDGSGVSGIDVPSDAISLVIHNPSYATLLIRWGATAVDVADPRGYDLALPGVSLAAIPIPEGVLQMSIDWVAPAAPAGYTANIDTTGVDAVTVWATAANQGTFVGSINNGPLPITPEA